MSPVRWAFVIVGVLGSAALAVAQGGQGAPGVPAAGRGGPARPEPFDFDDHTGWVSIFDGTLKEWDGNPAVWTVENGAITAASTEQRRVGTTYIIWKGGELGDFELKLRIKLEGDVHSGIAYRSWTDPNRAATLGPAVPAPAAPFSPAAAAAAAGRGRRGPQPPPQIPSDPRWMLYGPGCDYDADRRNSGNVEERGTARRLLAPRGSIVELLAGQRPRTIGAIADGATLMDLMKVEDWNQVHVIARGRQLTNLINGQVMAVAIDDDQTFFTPKGLIGWSMELGTGRVSVRDIWLRKL
jgi:3-keto-disaccharide hydrolase